jgi:hypothetical protein
MLGTQLGSATLLSLIPVAIRIRAIHKVIPPHHLRTFDLKNYKRVPEWLVEYKSLQYLLRIVLLYQVLVYTVCGLLLYLGIRWNAANGAGDVVESSAAHGDMFYFVAFHVVTAYNNCGFALMQDSFGSLQYSSVLFAMNCAILCGNVLYPILLRWLIILLSSIVRKQTNRKVYLRYLLLNGRHLYSSLFGSQQTWLLLIQQLILIFTQIGMTMALSSSYDPTFENALFRSVNARHAGFTTVALTGMNSGVLIMILSFMYLAPAPYIAMLKQSDLHYNTSGSIAGESFHSATGNEEDDFFEALDEESGNASPRATKTRFEEDTPPPSISSKSRKLSVKMARDNKPLHLQVSQPVSQNLSMTARRTQYGRSSVAASRRRRSHMLEEEMIDTRLLILTMYDNGKRVPLSKRVSLRAKAVWFQATLMGGQFLSSVRPDIFFLFFAWWFICACEGFMVTFEVVIPNNSTVVDTNANKVFSTLFEVVSSFGNVGLSMGEEAPGSVCAFAADLKGWSIIMLIIVQFAGKLRLFPNMTDSALSVINPVDASEVLSDEWLSKAVSSRDSSYDNLIGLNEEEEEEEEGGKEEKEGGGEFGRNIRSSMPVAVQAGGKRQEDDAEEERDDTFYEASGSSLRSTVSFAEKRMDNDGKKDEEGGLLKRDWKRGDDGLRVPLLKGGNNTRGNVNNV